MLFGGLNDEFVAGLTNGFYRGHILFSRLVAVLSVDETVEN